MRYLHSYSILCLCLLILSGCQKKREKSQLNFRDGLYYPVNSDSTYSGKIVTYYENGQYKTVIKVKDGLKDGLTKSWWENGRLESLKFYNNGVLSGKHKYYNQEGVLEKIEIYGTEGFVRKEELYDKHFITTRLFKKNGVLFKQRKVGEVRTIVTYYEKEDPIKRILYIYGSVERITHYNDNGSSVDHYQDGLLQKTEYYDLEGDLIN